MDNKKETEDVIYTTSSTAIPGRDNCSLNSDVAKQRQEIISKINASLASSEQISGLIRKSYIALSEAIKAIDPATQLADRVSKKCNELFKDLKFTIPVITIPKIEIPPELIDSFRRFSYLSLYHRVKWPLFLVDNDLLRQTMDPFLEDNNPDPLSFKGAVIGYFDSVGIETVTGAWGSSLYLEKERLRILQEAVDMYNRGYYYGCVATLMCQISGIISSSFYKLHSEGKEFDVDAVRTMYKSYNPQKTWDKRTEIKIIKGKNRIAEKEKLLCLLAEIDSGLLYWKAAADYLYSVVFTSDNDKNEHACRNKICHGEQLNYGDKEHAIKAILSVDLAIQLTEIIIASDD